MNTAWVWWEAIHWLNPTFSNYLKARWHHYRFCKRRAKVFILQRYLEAWKEDLQEKIATRPDDQVHSYGYYALWKMIQGKPPSEKLIEFLECKDLPKGIEELIGELNNFQIEEVPDRDDSKMTTAENNSRRPIAEKTDTPTQGPQEKTPTSEPEPVFTETVPRAQPTSVDTAHSSLPFKEEEIVTRTYVIAAHIYHQLYRTDVEYEELKGSRAEYVEFIRQQFRVEKLAGTIYELRNFDYTPILHDKSETRRGQLYPQLQQIAKNPPIFGKKVSQYVEDLLKKYFEYQRNNELHKKG
jgi:hypothetical protein